MASPQRDRSLRVSVTLLLALVGGAVVWLLTDLVSRSDIQGDGWSLRGNGAIVVPTLLVPLFLALGWAAIWTGARRQKRKLRPPEVLALVGVPLAVFGGCTAANVAIPAWVSSVQVERAGHSATLLRDGRVLIAGGGGTYGPLDSSFLYDPGTGTWSSTGRMPEATTLHAATLLQDGSVLVVGGFTTTEDEPAQVYDPGTDRWTRIGGPSTTRFARHAVLLPDGRALVLARHRSEEALAAELYDPATTRWSPVPAPTTLRRLSAMTMLPNGAVFAIGSTVRSLDGEPEPSAETFALPAATWVSAASPGFPGDVALLLPTRQVLLLGGETHGAFMLAELSDTNVYRWQRLDSPRVPRFGGYTATLLADGRVLLAGGTVVTGDPPLGRAVADVEILDPSTGRWSPATSMGTPRVGHTATLLPDGQVMVVGGGGRDGPLASAERYDPTTNGWTPTASLNGR